MFSDSRLSDSSTRRGVERLTVFVIRVRAAKSGRRPGLDSKSQHFTGTSHHVVEGTPFEWSDPTGRVLVKVWPKSAAQLSDDGLRIDAGWPVKVSGRLAGHYSSVRIDSAGRGVVQQDQFGLHPLYSGSAGGVSIVSNRPHLVADEIERITGSSIVRDHRFSAWLAFSGYPISDRTGFEDVSCVPMGATVRIHPRKGIKCSPAREPWLLGSNGIDESDIDRIESDLIENLRAAIGQLGYPPLLQLTGGRDSRLTLALSVRGGLLKDVEVVTLGNPEAPDAVIAAELATRLGIPHTVMKWSDGVVARSQLCAHVGRVAGSTNCFDSGFSLSEGGRLSFSGLTGEALRSNWPLRSGAGDVDSAIYKFLTMPLGRTCILRREACEIALRDGLQSLLELVSGGAQPEDLFDAYYVQHRLRRWLASRPERFADEFFPLYHPPATVAAFQLAWDDRAAGRIHDTIIGRTGQLFSGISYYKPGGYYKLNGQYAAKKRRVRLGLFGRFRNLTARVQSRRGYGNCDQWVSAAIDKSFARNKPLAKLREGNAKSSIGERRKAAYRELILAREDNPAFDLINRNRLFEAIDALECLDGLASQEVHAAMTGVIWLGQLEDEG